LQPQETAKDAKRFVCSNASCRRAFTHPLKTVNIGTSTAPYDACPYCLTEVTRDTVAVLAESTPKAEISMQPPTKKQDAPSHAPDGCKNQFGYLGQRASKEIPDECLTCKLIVKCMLKNAKDQVGLE
jgi:hypothetical protein